MLGSMSTDDHRSWVRSHQQEVASEVEELRSKMSEGETLEQSVVDIVRKRPSRRIEMVGTCGDDSLQSSSEK